MTFKVSIITASYNSADTIERCIVSVLEQSYPDIEHILVDAKSTDGTLELIDYLGQRDNCISERDLGIYDAFNKGLRRATGDVVFFLNSDDRFTDHNVVESAVEKMHDSKVDILLRSVKIVSEGSKILRQYRARPVTVKHLEKGFMPPHTGAFIKKSLFDRVGDFRTDLKISGDYEWFCRLAKVGSFSQEVDKHCFAVEMASGGTSSRDLRARLIAHNENFRSLRESGLRASHARLLMRYFSKIFEYRFEFRE